MNRWATQFDDFAVIIIKLWLTIKAIFQCMTLSCQDCSLSLIFVYYCQPQKRPKNGIWVKLLEHLVISYPNSVFVYQELVQSWFACISLGHPLGESLKGVLCVRDGLHEKNDQRADICETTAYCIWSVIQSQFPISIFWVYFRRNMVTET